MTDDTETGAERRRGASNRNLLYIMFLGVLRQMHRGLTDPVKILQIRFDNSCTPVPASCASISSRVLEEA